MLAVASANSLDYIAVLLACMRQGIVVLPLHLRLTESEWQTQLETANAKLVLSESELSNLPFPRMSFEQLQNRAANLEPNTDASPEVVPEAIFALLFTSGSSGHVKCVRLSVQNFLFSAQCSNQVTCLEHGERWLLSLPLYHVAGLSIVFRALLASAAIRVPQTSDLAGVRNALSTPGLTYLSLVPSMLASLLDDPASLSALKASRCVLLGGAATPQPLAEKVIEQGIPAYCSYGMSETCSHVTLAKLSTDAAKIGSSGRALPGMEIEIHNDQGQAVAPGVVGEIAIKSESVFDSYHNPSDTKRMRGSWFLSNDLGYLSESGEIIVGGRQEEMIISGGENIHLAEIRRCAENHPDIGDCAVIAEAHPRWGQRPVLLYTEASPGGLPTERLQHYLRENLAAIKCPERIVLLSRFPKTAIGKADISRLREFVGLKN